jgi:uncharacterized protein involved in outer membrane biogenesis
MKKYALILTGFVVLIVGAALAAPGLIDWESHKPEIQKRIAEATGYDVSFGGRIQLAILPFPHVVVENVAVKIPADSAGGEALDLVTLKKAEVSVALAPLFRKEISISKIDLVDPVITLNVARDGRKLWMTDTLTSKTPGNSSGAEGERKARTESSSRFALKELQIENGTVSYNDASTGKKQHAEKVNAVISADSLAGPFKGKGDLLWSGQKIEADIQSGRIDQAAKTLAVEAALKLSDTGAALSYSGVVGTGGALDLQGETNIQTGNLSATLTALSGKASTLPPVPFKVQGLLTVRPGSADLKTMKLVLGDFQSNGSLTMRNFQAKDGPVQVTATLNSATALKLESIMPVKSVKSVRAAANDDAPKVGGIKAFLPETLQLPMPVDIDADISLASVSYKGAEFGNVTIGLEKKGGLISISENVAQMPGGGKLAAKTSLNYASGSQGADKTGVTYSDPTLSFDMQGSAKAPGKLLSAFLPESTIKSMQPLFKDPLALSAKGNIHAKQAAIDSGSVSIGATALNLGASSYTLDPSGKDDVVLSVSGHDIDLDHFMGAREEVKPEDKVQVSAPAAPKKPAAQALQESIRKLNLPVDLTVKADLTNVTMQGVTYRAVNIDGTLKGAALNVATASLTDPQGDVMKASGAIGDLPNLGGVDITLGGKTGDAVAFLSSFKVDTSKFPKNFGPLDLSVSLTGEKPDSLAFNASAKALEGEGSASGLLLKAMSDKPAVDKLSFHITHPNFEKLAQKFNPSYKAGVGIRKDMDVQANINLESGVYSLSGLKAVIGGMDLTGTVTADVSGTKPDVKAVLSGGTVPLDILSGKNKTASSTGSVTTQTKTVAGSDVRWSRNAINTAWMQAFNLDLKFNAKTIEYGNWTLSDAALGATLKDGTLTIGQMNASVYGGTMGLTATLRSTGKDRDPVSFNVKTNFKDVGLEPLAASFSGARPIKARGDVSLDLEAQSSGISPAALISALSGKGNIDGRKVVFEGFDLAAMSRSLVSTTKVFDNISGLVGASTKGGETSFDTIEGPFTIAEGIINFDNFLMKGATANIASKGQISLPRWFIDMNSSIDLAQPEDAPNLDVRFQGPLDNPGNTFAGQAMQSYVQGRVNQKLQKAIGDKLGDKNPELNKLLNNVLGGGAPQPAPAPVPAPEQQIAPSSGEAAPATQTQPEPALQPEQKKLKPEEEIMKGVLEGIMGGH